MFLGKKYTELSLIQSIVGIVCNLYHDEWSQLSFFPGIVLVTNILKILDNIISILALCLQKNIDTDCKIHLCELVTCEPQVMKEKLRADN